MPHDFIPSRQADLLDWSQNLCNRITASPGSFSLSPAQAAHYAVLNDAFAASHAAARNPNTNSKAAIIAKNDAKDALVANARLLAHIIRATPGLDNKQRAQLGLTVPDEKLTPSPRPSDPPDIMVLASVGPVLRLRVRDKAEPMRRGKPPGIAGAAVFSYIGDKMPARMSELTFHGYMTRTIFQISFDPATPAGAQVWIAACWYNTRGQSGPMCMPLKMRVPGGVAGAGAAA